MKHFAYIVAFALSLCSVPVWAETSLPDDTRSASAIQPYSGIFSFSTLSPIHIEADGFTLIADSCSL